MASSCCERMVHVRIQLSDRPCLAFPMSTEEYLELEERYFEVILGDGVGEVYVPIRLPIFGGGTLPVPVEEIVLFELLHCCPADTECLGLPLDRRAAVQAG
jgi:hypothetical protein